jgi:hypothetical protein
MRSLNSNNSREQQKTYRVMKYEYADPELIAFPPPSLEHPGIQLARVRLPKCQCSCGVRGKVFVQRPGPTRNPT